MQKKIIVSPEFFHSALAKITFEIILILFDETFKKSLTQGL